MKHYQNAMGIVHTIEKTRSLHYDDVIKENLLSGQQPSDRLDFTARVFDMVKKHLLDLISRENFFGESRAFVYTIESQKRGLLHIHLIVTLKDGLPIPEIVDNCMSAEIPDPELYPDLHRIVMSNMIHGPCGA